MLYWQRFVVAFLAAIGTFVLLHFIFRKKSASQKDVAGIAGVHVFTDDERRAAVSNPCASLGSTESYGFGPLPNGPSPVDLMWHMRAQHLCTPGVSFRDVARSLNKDVSLDLTRVRPRPLTPVSLRMTVPPSDAADAVMPPNASRFQPCPQPIAADGVSPEGVPRELQPGPCMTSSWACLAGAQ